MAVSSRSFAVPGERGTSTLHPDRGIAIRDVWVPDYTHATDRLRSLRVLAEEGKITMRVARIFPAAEAAAAHRALERGGVRGRLVLTFDGNEATIEMTPIGVGIIGARNVAALDTAFARDLSEGTGETPSFGDAVRLHRLVGRIARGASTAGTMTADLEETPCALQS